MTNTEWNAFLAGMIYAAGPLRVREILDRTPEAELRATIERTDVPSVLAELGVDPGPTEPMVSVRRLRELLAGWTDTHDTLYDALLAELGAPEPEPDLFAELTPAERIAEHTGDARRWLS